jgi:release factor glutamine methyltransferase
LTLAIEHWTVLKVLEWTQNYFRKKEIPNPRLESEILLSHTLGFDRVGLYLHYDMTLSPSELSGFRGLIERRITGEPLQYITGYQEFWSIRFKVNSSVLIPRPETEVLVQEALYLIDLEGWQEPRIVEVGTGCGAIAISIVKSSHSTKAVATEISSEALALATENALVQGVASRIAFVQGNWLSFVKSTWGVFDLIISNPPYIKRGDIDNLQPEIRDFEPRKALDGGIGGLDFHRGLLAEAPRCLRTGGWLILEMGADQSADIVELAKQIGGLKEARILSDYSGKSRAFVAQKA